MEEMAREESGGAGRGDGGAGGDDDAGAAAERSLWTRRTSCWRSARGRAGTRLASGPATCGGCTQRHADSEGWKATVRHARTPRTAGGYKEIVVELVGDESCTRELKWEAGVHRVQRVPATESQGRDADVHGDGGGDARGGRGGGEDRRQGHRADDRAVRRRGRAEREQGGDGGGPGAQAHGDPDLLHGGAHAAEEPHPRDADPAVAPVRAAAGGAGRRRSRGGGRRRWAAARGRRRSGRTTGRTAA